MDEVILQYLSHFEEPLRQQGLQVSQLQVVSEMLDYSVQYLSPSSRHYGATWYQELRNGKTFCCRFVCHSLFLCPTLPWRDYPAALEG